MSKVENLTCQQLADAYAAQHCLARDGGLTEYGCELIAFGRWLDGLVKRNARSTILKEMRETQTGAAYGLAETAFELVEAASFMAVERRVEAAYAHLTKQGVTA